MVLVWAVLMVLTVAAFWKGLIFRSKDEDVIKDLSRRSSLDEKAAPFPPPGLMSAGSSTTHVNHIMEQERSWV